MKLIKELGKKLIPSGKERKTYGLFECPVCLQHVEKPITHGSRNKTCGSQACRSEALQYNIKSKEINPDADSKHPYYHTITSKYRTILNSQETDFESAKKFFHTIKDEYSQMRAKGISSIEILPMDPEKNIGPNNYKLISTSDSRIMSNQKILNDRIANGKYDSRTLAHVLDKNHDFVKRHASQYLGSHAKICKYNLSNGEISVYEMTKEQFDGLKEILQYNSNKNKSNKVYIVESCGYYKIGITHNIEKRMKGLEASSPMEYNLLKLYDIDNAQECEKYIHNKYSSMNHKYEWFKLSESELNDVINSIEVTLIDDVWTYPESSISVAVKKIYTPKDAIEKKEYDVVSEPMKVDRSGSNVSHGKSNTPIYKAWQTIKQKVKNDDTLCMCDEWQDSERFINDIESEYNKYKNPMITITNSSKVYDESSIIISERSMPSTAKSVQKIHLMTDEVICEYESAAEAARSISGIANKISSCCIGKAKSHKGYKWRYSE